MNFLGHRSILVLNNAPVYDKIFITAIFAAKDVKVLFQPHKCPRLNSTEPCHHIESTYNPHSLKKDLILKSRVNMLSLHFQIYDIVILSYEKKLFFMHIF